MKLTEAQITRVKMLESERGELTPDMVLADAIQGDSPLHDLIDWDTSKAAHAWWLECARDIIRSVKVVITTTTTTLQAPYYTRDPDATGQGYRSVVALQRDAVAARQTVIDELTRAAGSVQRARTVALVLNLETEVDALLAQIMGVQLIAEQREPQQPSLPS